jgi:ABC-type Fe3+ transport system substrate-binding protein
MKAVRYLLAAVFVALIAAPLALRRDAASDAGSPARRLIIVTPHPAQLREEFAWGFDEWHREAFGEPVEISYLTPGGTSEIIKQLRAQYEAAWNNGAIDRETLEAVPGAIPIDLMFGGGSYDHGRLMTELTVPDPAGGPPRAVPMSVPAGFDQATLDEWFGENRIGSQPLYEPGQHWLATAVSSFGIVYNREMYALLGLDPPASFDDLARPELLNSVAMADPRQSGSITTTLDYILTSKGWDSGWRLLREISANSRYFSASSTKPPIDISAGEAAVGLCIDFYGRGQAQTVLAPGQHPDQGRVGYIDPDGSVFVDPDPISVLRGGPEPELARRFIEFLLSERGQAIWNFPPRDRQATPALDPQGRPMGPMTYALRRLPARRVMYERYRQHFIDTVDPYELAGEATPAGWRSAIGPVMGAFGIDTHDELRDAWAALNRARADASFPATVLAEMEGAFYAMPDCAMPDGTSLPFSEANYRAIRGSWRDPTWAARSRGAFIEFFRRQYRLVTELERAREPIVGSAGGA